METTTNNQPTMPRKTTPKPSPRQVSLRSLARELSVNHSSLSAAIRDGRLTRGVRIDDAGRAIVIDADAAIANWRDVHVPQILEVERARERARIAVRRLAKAEPDAIELWDRAYDCLTTAAHLFADRDALSLLVTALAAITAEFAGSDRAAIERHVAERLEVVAELHGADDHDIEHATKDFAFALDLLESAATEAAEEQNNQDNQQETT